MTRPLLGTRSGSAGPSVPWGSALRNALRPRALRRTVPAALVVGTALWFVNLAGTFLDGRATAFTLMQSVLTFVIPWLNATFGMTMAFRSPIAAPSGALDPLDPNHE